MDCLTRIAQISKKYHIRNTDIRFRINVQQTIVDRVHQRGLKWFGRVLQMEEHRWLNRIEQCTPPGKRKSGRPRRSWNEGIRKAMEERNLEKDNAQDQRRWRLGVRFGNSEKPLIYYIYDQGCSSKYV